MTLTNVEFKGDGIVLFLESGKKVEFTIPEMLQSKKIKKCAEEVVEEFEEMKAMNDNSTFRLIEKIHSLTEALEK